MATFTTENLRHEARFAVRITLRDAPKRIAALGMILVALWFEGHAHAVYAITAISAVLEIAALGIVAKVRREPTRDLSLPTAVLMWAINVTSTVAYLVPAVYLATSSLAFVLIGALWLFGVLVYVSNLFVALPLFNATQVVPGFGCAFSFLIAAWWSAPPDLPEWHWYAAFGFLVVYCTNTFETSVRQKDIQADLATARKEAQARLRALEHMTRHDGLTGLLNRAAFDDRLSGLLQAEPAGSQVGVFLLDLDGFKPINDTYSHRAGDAVLMAVARRIDALASPHGLSARLGGDEFAVAMPGLGSAEAALAFGQALAQSITRPILHDEKMLQVGASIGVTLGRGNLPDQTVTLLSRADQAMFRAKAFRTGEVVLFDAADFAPRLTLDHRRALSNALWTGDIRPHYQPMVELASGEICGFEALARWQTPTGLLRAEEFMPQINDLGLQGDFLAVMAQQVLTDIDRLLEAGLDPMRVSINMPEALMATQSGRNELDRLLDLHPRAAGLLRLEITEDVFIARSGEMIQQSIAHFRARGLGISLDDFGTGYASFNHLRQLDLDEIKIDPSFVAGIDGDPVNRVLLEGFLRISQGIGVRVVAEGVETEEQRAYLVAQGCRYGQGYFFHGVLPLEAAMAQLRLHHARRAAAPTLRSAS